jgi:cytochrome c oxidase cbb3-type subunit 3
MSLPGADAPQAATPSAADPLLDHEYDGIREYDNPLPGWWLATLYGTIIFAVLYFLNVIPGLGSGKGRIADYDATMTAAQAATQAAAAGHDPLAGLTDAALLAVAKDPAKLALGRTTFATMCVACHGPDGGGIIGPNLTDAYWLHGGRPTDILHTVNNGVPEKGMPTWGKTIPADQVIAVAAYVTTLQGTTPKAPKAPQGVRADSAPPAPAGR